MKVILTENVKLLGSIGEVIKVSSGYARNFLLPKGFAVFADDKNQRVLQNQKKALSKKVDNQRKLSLEIKEKLDGLEVLLTKRVGGSGKLFGTVTTAELSTELAKKDIHVEKRLLQIDTPIKSTGSFPVKAKIFDDIESEFQVKVEMDPRQLEELKKKSRGKGKGAKVGKLEEGLKESASQDAEEKAKSLEVEEEQSTDAAAISEENSGNTATDEEGTLS